MSNKAYKAFTQRRKENGLCKSCGNPTNDNGIYCHECAWLRNVRRKITKMRKKKGTWTGKFWDDRTKRLICLGILEKWGII